MTRWHRH